MKIKVTENQLKKIAENVKSDNLNEGLTDFLKGAYSSIKTLVTKFKDGDLSKADFEKELEKLKNKEEDSGESGEIPKGKGYGFNKSHGFKSKERPTHGGVDFHGKEGDKIVIKKTGEVVGVSTGCSVGNQKCGGGCGNYVKIKHEDGNTTMYCHMTDVYSNIKTGTKIKPGKVIGTIGNTGFSFGDHLHLQFWNGGNLSDGSSQAEKYFVILDKSSKYGEKDKG
jgi:murein DD-endopeptidase MepM/ murein hydrolase activator NlpD